MKLLLAAGFALPLLACAPEARQAAATPNQATRAELESADSTMEVSRSAARQPAAGPIDWFTGRVTITPLFEPKGPSQVGAALVRFEPGARTAWHKHPLGQRLVVLEGTGLTQVESGAIELIHAGDVVWCPPDKRHWHGTTSTGAMAHIAVQEAENGSPVEWMEQVPDQLYRAGPA